MSLNGLTIGLEETKAVGAAGLEEFSFPVQVRVGETVKLKIGLRSPNVLNTFSPVSALTLNWEKQPGLAPEAMRVTVNFPAGLTADAVNLPTVNSPGQVQYLVQFKQDQSLAVLFKAR